MNAGRQKAGNEERTLERRRRQIPSSDSVLLGMANRVIGRSGAGSVHGIANRPGEDFRLVVATGATAGPMEGNREDEVHVGKVGSRSDAPAEKGAIKTTGFKVPVVFQGAGDGAVRAFVVHEGRSVGIVHALGGVPVPLQDGIEAVGKGVVRLQPVIGVRAARGVRGGTRKRGTRAEEKGPAGREEKKAW